MTSSDSLHHSDSRTDHVSALVEACWAGNRVGHIQASVVTHYSSVDVTDVAILLSE